ncbi:phytoene/squalene synthase family protein [Marilutibacter spongiae]|uniref:Phytoene/squalene synthase family protein n=1 Tax=Marilutibacter spongiae TaxID=2025720 RepID=A0A7W3Y5Z9_9GAMM|nr:phytoene/squalene synthase family protein [Lysobacter spongiae]MBB1060569.1 phytoene/squalene synthase family protein [Lysobacter spongiae]
MPLDTDQAALESFVAKWRERWPEWNVMEVFVPAAQRPLALAWAALLQELTDAAWRGEDARPGEAKLAWWQEELQGWSLGRRRHPLGLALQKQPAPWDALATALPGLVGSRERPRDMAEAYDGLAAFSAAVVDVERVLLPAAVAAAADEAERDAVSAVLLQSRCMLPGDAHVPMAVFARAGEGDPVAIWRQQLRQRWPAQPPAGLPRRLWSRLARARLRQADPARPLKPWSAVLLGWRAARRGPRN